VILVLFPILQITINLEVVLQFSSSSNTMPFVVLSDYCITVDPSMPCRSLSVKRFKIVRTRNKIFRNVTLLFFFLSSLLGDTGTNCEVHLNLEELLELQHKREPVS